MKYKLEWPCKSLLDSSGFDFAHGLVQMVWRLRYGLVFADCSACKSGSAVKWRGEVFVRVCCSQCSHEPHLQFEGVATPGYF